MRGQDKAEAYYHLLESMADEHEVEYNPAPGPKWQAINGILRMPNLNATEMAVAACLIDHAHDEHGFAFPSRKTIQNWTGRPKSAVDRALGKLKRLGLVEGRERRLSYTNSETTLYAIIWQPFFKAFQKVEAWKSERRHARNVAEGVVPANGTGWSPKSGQVVPANGEQISLIDLSKEDLSRSSYDDPLKDFHEGLFGETRGLSERVESQKDIQWVASCESESNDRLPAEPKGFNNLKWWKEQLTRAEVALKEETDPNRRSVVEGEIERRRRRIEELENEQRAKACAR